MEAKKYKIAIVGCGWIGFGAQLDVLRLKPASHAEAVEMFDKTELSALVDCSNDALKNAKHVYPNVLQYTTIEEMFKVISPDIVIISTEPKEHPKLIIEVAKHGVKAILCEKPISHNIKDSKKSIDVCKKNNVLLFVNHQRRFDPLLREFRDYVQHVYVKDTFIGEIKCATAFYDKGILHAGTHFIDLLQFFLGKILWVSANYRKNVQNIEDDFTVDALLGFKNSTASILYFDSKNYGLSEVSFYGTTGKMVLREMSGSEVETIGVTSSSEYSAYKELDYKKTRIFGKPRSLLTPVLPHIVDCLENRDQPVSTGDDALSALKVIFALKKSADKKGQKQLV